MAMRAGAAWWLLPLLACVDAAHAEAVAYYELPRLDVRANVIELLRQSRGGLYAAQLPPVGELQPVALPPVEFDVEMPDVRDRVLQQLEQARRDGTAEPLEGLEPPPPPPEPVPPPTQPAPPPPKVEHAPAPPPPAPVKPPPPKPAPKPAPAPERPAAGRGNYTPMPNKVINIGGTLDLEQLKRELQEAAGKK